MARKVKYPGVSDVINGNGAVAYVMNHVCGGVIGYPITPSTEISELFEAARAQGSVNVWGKHPFFFEPEGEHSAQGGALGAALTGGQYISNASSSQGILYAMESHYVTVGKKIGGFVLQVAARVVSKHSLNVMAGHDDIYALLPAGYTILFGASPQEAADLAAIAYRVSALSLIPVANAMDGFSTSHMLSNTLLPEPELLKEYIGDPASRIHAPTVAQEMLYGAKGRVHQLKQYLEKHHADIDDIEKIEKYLTTNADKIEKDNDGKLLGKTVLWLPSELQGQWRRQWLNAFEKGTRQLVPALVDIHNPGMTGPVQNQPDFQAGAADHRTHFISEVPDLVVQAMDEYASLTGRKYSPVHTFMCDDADYVMVGLGCVTEDVEAVVTHLRAQGQKVGLVAIKLLQPFPEAEVVKALKGKKAITILERSDQTALTGLVTQALFKACENAGRIRYPGIPALKSLPVMTTAIFGLGGHDLQPRHLIAAFKNMSSGKNTPLIYLGSQFFAKNPSPAMAKIQSLLKKAYPETELMALETEPNPNLLPDDAFRIRFHSVGGYGTIASGKLLTDILAGVLNMYSKSAPKYGSEKSGAPTNYYITLSPEPIKITNADLEDVEIVISPDHKVFEHTNPLKGLAEGGTFILQSNASPEEVWERLPVQARKTIRTKKIRLFIIDAFAVAKRHAPTPELETRMMGVAFIGAVMGHVDRIAGGSSSKARQEKVQQQLAKKFGAKGSVVVESNMNVIREAINATQQVNYESAAFVKLDTKPEPIAIHQASLSASMCPNIGSSSCNGLFDKDYYEEMIARPFREGTISEAPVYPGSGLFVPPGTAAAKDKGMFRRAVPQFIAELCSGCMECALACPDAAIPNNVHDIHDLLLTAIRRLDVTEAQREAMRATVYSLAESIRENYRQSKEAQPFAELVAEAAASITQPTLKRNFARLVEILKAFPVARTRPFFDAMEKANPGSGGLYSVNIDPWKCTGCLECVEVCGPNALVAQDQDDTILADLQHSFDFLAATPGTPARFVDGAIDPAGDTKRIFLDRSNYYAMTGGHGACRGCGEVTAIRLVTSASRAIADKSRADHIVELEQLIHDLAAKRDSLSSRNTARRKRIDTLITTLEKRLYHYESGPGGHGPAGTIIANATGCSSVYASTLPFNCYTDPWVNSLFHDTQPLAKGIFEGLTAQLGTDIKALRLAHLELDDAYDPKVHDAEMQYLSWTAFTQKERQLLPNILTIGGDGASYDIGFGAMSRILASNTPIKMMVLNTGAYSNTGGQASTSSLTGQDSDLSRFGHEHHGKHEARKELALIAAFHPNVLVCASSTALQGHFLKSTMAMLTATDLPAIMDVYTPCQPEHGIADSAANLHARMAVESRMNPVFIHDPRRGKTLHEWFSLEGNPDPDKTWMTTTLEYLDDQDQLQLMEMPLTPATFALSEGRFKKQFSKLKSEENAMPVEEYIDLPEGERARYTPFVYSTDAKKHLIRVAVSPTLIRLVEDRRKYWQTLQYLDGQHVAKMESEHKASMDALMAQYQESLKSRESAMDSFARAMSELAASSKAPSQGFSFGNAPAAPAASAPAAAPAAASGGQLVAMTNQALCNNCKTCYQDIPEIFEKVRKIFDGESREVAQITPGSLEKVNVTPDLENRIQRVVANCDAEILE